MTTGDKKFEEIAIEIAQTLKEKDAAYGSAFDKAAKFFELLYPNGIKPEQYGDMLCLARMFDKQMRIANKKDAFGESPYMDLIGYAILGERRERSNKESK